MRWPSPSPISSSCIHDFYAMIYCILERWAKINPTLLKFSLSVSMSVFLPSSVSLSPLPHPVSVCAHLQRPEEEIRFYALSVHFIPFEVGSVTDPKTRLEVSKSRWGSCWSSPQQHRSLQEHTVTPSFIWALEHKLRSSCLCNMGFYLLICLSIPPLCCLCQSFYYQNKASS